MNFTEEQYQEIINIWRNEQDFDGTILSVTAYVRRLSSKLTNEDDDVYDYGEAILLALPNSREWAHEQFVEKEKKYVWRLKSDNGSVINKTCGVWFLDKTPSGVEYFSEKEINNSPFKPEWFDKEEVE